MGQYNHRIQEMEWRAVFMRWRDRLARWMYGRNGADALYYVAIGTSLGLSVLQLFIGSWILFCVELLLLFWATFRFFSKNVYKRQKENRAFLSFWGRIRNFFRLRRQVFKDRKTHVFRKCPACKKHLRLPRIKGAHTVCCPCCGKRFSVRV